VSEPLPVHSRIDLPPEMEVGVHADFVSVWHTPESFVLDFLALKGPAATAQDEDGRPVQLRDARVAARVRLAPTHVFDLMRALEIQLTAWEQETGQRPGPTV
jgi:hypothetical protein